MSSELTQLRKPSRVRVVDDARRSLEDAILSGRMRPGERLAETWLCQQLGVSRTTVREALLMLESQGLVVTIPRRGTFVTRLSRQDARDVCYLRALLEGFAVSTGYGLIDATVLRQLAACVDRMGGCVLPADLPRLIQIDIEFHTPLISCAGSPRLVSLWASLSGPVGSVMLRTLEAYQAGISEVVQLHRDLLGALATGDPEHAATAVISHYVFPERLNDEVAQRALATARLMSGLYGSTDFRDFRAAPGELVR